jgi:hypothetical protein
MTWTADFIVSGLVAAIVTFFLIDWLGDRACRQLGGTLSHGGLDRICTLPDGSITTGTLVKGSTILYVWMGTTAVFLLLARLFIKRGASSAKRR